MAGAENLPPHPNPAARETWRQWGKMSHSFTFVGTKFSLVPTEVHSRYIEKFTHFILTYLGTNND